MNQSSNSNGQNRSVRLLVRRALRRYRALCDRGRATLRRLEFEDMGARCSLGRRVDILGYGKIILGERVAIRGDVVLAGNGCLKIGSRSAINSHCIITATERVEIGQDCMVAPFCYIMDVTHVIDDTRVAMRDQGNRSNPVVIEDDVWIAAGSFVLPGVTIGKGSVVAANSVVNRSVPPYCIVGGSPARVLKRR